MRTPLIICAGLMLVAGPAAAAVPFVAGPVDTVGNVGLISSLAFDDQGRPHIAYWHSQRTDLLYATRSGGVWRFETVDSDGFVGTYPSLALDSGGSPHICYHHSTKGALKYARLVAGSWATEIVDSVGSAGIFPSLALDSFDRPRVAYYVLSSLDLRHAARGDSFWSIETLDWDGDVGAHPTLVLDAADRPHISYLDRTNRQLRYTVKYAFNWWPETVTTEFDVEGESSLALDERGIPHVAFIEIPGGRIQYATRETGAWVIEALVHPGTADFYLSLALGSDRTPHIAYHNSADDDLRYGVRRDGTWEFETVDTEGGVGDWPSLALDANGNPAITYYDDWNTDLKFAESGVCLASPNGGETWPVGAERTIRWLGAGSADVLLSVDGGSSYELLAEGVDRNRIVARVPHAPTRFGRVQVRRSDPFSTSESDSFFTIAADISLLSLKAALLPGGGASIEWLSDPGPEDLAGYKLEKTTGGSWQTLVGLTSATSYHDAIGGAGSKYRLFGVNGLGDELTLGETTIAPRTPLAAWPLPYNGGSLNISFATYGGLGGGTGRAEVTLFNLAGRKVRSIARGQFEAGHHTVSWDGLDDTGRHVGPGSYFLRARSNGGENSTLKLVVLQ